MDIWIIRDGQRAGPIHDYEIRRRIEDHQIDPSTPAWHEGLPEWLPIREIQLFENEFRLASTESPGADSAADRRQDPPSTPDPASEKSTPVAAKALGRRFWARWFDLVLFSGLWWLAMWVARRDIEATLLNRWVLLFQYVPWFILESILLHYLGTTPGKWLLGLSVRNQDGTRLSLAAASRRSLRVMVMGIGFGWGWLAVFCQAISLFTTRRVGKPIWDHVGGHQVIVSPINPLRSVVFAFLIFGAAQLQLIVVYPYLTESFAEQFPEYKHWIDSNPQWHLPRRSR